ncbi:unnamed protein product [Parnassius apollo]|uniref:(apollo) hypothetical protein n=1 Tax=Parnassius apollo TaxID=110799 RepID=A0A8S3W983_PARAO|nr:unnamed protein product [Parnassius apollo]
MEEWEAIVDKYEEPVEPRSFLKACQSVKTLLEQDLAPFEIDWLLDTLFLKPVNLITTVATKCSDDAWSQSIGDAFKLLSELIMKHPDHASPHFENIVKLCNLSYDARTRQHALHCLTCVVRHSDIGAANHLRYIHALEEDSTCKATMAELVGAICEYHPDMVSEDVTTIWRVYLNLLDSNKFSDTVVRSVLLGILGLFKLFSMDLPTAELNEFYDKLDSCKEKYRCREDYFLCGFSYDIVVRSVLLGILGLFKLFSMDLPTAELNEFYDKLDSCKEKYRCREVYLTILEHYAGLFRERLSADASARKLLWTWLAAQASPQTRPALISVYREIGDTVDETTIRRIVTSEVLPHLQDARAHVRLTAASVLRVCIPYSEDWQENTHALADAPALQHALAAGSLNNDDVETIKWWIETYTSQDDKILKTAIMFHEHIPVKHRKQVVAYGILKAPHDVRTEVVTFLINETCQSYKDNGNFNKYMPLWRSLFDTVKGTDTVVTKSCCLVLDAIMDYLVYNLESFLEIAGSDSEELPDKLRCLLVVSSQIIPLLEMVDGDRERCLHALQLLHDLRLVCSSAVSAILGAIRAIALYLDDYEVISDDRLLVRIDNCRDNVDLYESCLALILTPVKSVRDIPSLLTALQITFARRDVEPAMLSRSIRTLESLILTQKEKLDDTELNDVINHVERMYHRIDLKAKEGRSLRRDVLMFLGKYGTGSDVNNNSDDEVTVHLKSSLTLGIPDPSEGITDKVNLERILRLALKYEDAKALRVLIEILYANGECHYLCINPP